MPRSPRLVGRRLERPLSSSTVVARSAGSRAASCSARVVASSRSILFRISSGKNQRQHGVVAAGRARRRGRRRIASLFSQVSGL